MAKIGFIFPGQGAQKNGMSRDFYEQLPECRAIMDMASEATGLDLKKICFDADERLDQTEYTQVALLTAELMVLEAVKQRVHADLLAGQSLGEYAALVASGSLSAQDAVKIVRQRGILMQNAVPLGEGAMVAIVGLNAEQIEAMCRETDGEVQVSNYNTAKQSVVSGRRDAVMRVKQMAEEAGARLATELKVSIPSHSQLMRPAAEKLEPVLQQAAFQPIQIPYIANATAEVVTDEKRIASLLAEQLYSAVRWEQSIMKMKEAGIECLIEIGPGETLTKMNKKIDKTIQAISISSVEDLEKL